MHKTNTAAHTRARQARPIVYTFPAASPACR